MGTFAELRLKDRLALAARFHWQNGWAALQRFSPWILLVPAAAIGLIVLDAHTAFGWFEQKATQEIVAPTVLAVAVFVAGLYWAGAADFCSQWLLLLSVALFCRELHFWGTNNGIYLAILMLLWYASRNAHRMPAFFESRLLMSLFGCALFTYALTKTFDRGYWRFIAGW